MDQEEGDRVEEGEVIAEVETDKARMEMESFFEGTVLKILVEAGNPVTVGAPMAIIGAPGEDISGVLAGLGGGGQAQAPAAAPAEAEAAPAPQAPAAEPQGDGDRLLASPVARRIAREHQVDLAAVEGSGPRGRIIKKDVEAALERRPAAAPAAPAPAPAAKPAQAAPAPAGAAGAAVPLTAIRRTIARRMTESWTSAPHFSLSTTIAMERAMALRADLNAQLKAAGSDVKLSVNDLVLKACALALRQVPGMNVAWGGDHIVQHDAVHIGVAVAMEGGLITPVVRDADVKTLGAIARDIRDLAARGREKRLAPEEYTGSTFSISNLGMFGITHFMAVLNPPEAGILAVGAVVDRPVVRDGQVVAGQEMEVTLSCDHRSTDGALGAQLLQAIKRLLENPVLLTV